MVIFVTYVKPEYLNQPLPKDKLDLNSEDQQAITDCLMKIGIYSFTLANIYSDSGMSYEAGQLRAVMSILLALEEMHNQDNYNGN